MKPLIISLVSACLYLTVQAQEKKSHIEQFIGTWKGTSLCQVKNSPCHDEVVVYYIARIGTTDSCNIKGYKIVNGEELFMGDLPCTYEAKTNELNSTAYGIWNYKLADGKMKGTLISKGNLYRIIDLNKLK